LPQVSKLFSARYLLESGIRMLHLTGLINSVLYVNTHLAALSPHDAFVTSAKHVTNVSRFLKRVHR